MGSKGDRERRKRKVLVLEDGDEGGGGVKEGWTDDSTGFHGTERDSHVRARPMEQPQCRKTLRCRRGFPPRSGRQ
jgi:hypothetical protein